MSDFHCQTCGGVMVQKGRLKLFMVGVLMVACTSASLFIPYFWIANPILLLAGLYLIVWGTLGKGRWCRSCKKFSIQKES